MFDADRILIVGGGIGGLCLATALHREGFAAEVVERSPTWPALGAGIALHANGVRVLRSLGLGAAIDGATATLPRWAFLDQRGELLCETDLEALWGGVGPCLGITRVRLQEMLLEAAAPVPHRLGVAVTALEQDGGRVTVGFGDGSSGDYDLVVGADGINSTVRRLAVIPAPPAYAGTMAWGAPRRPAAGAAGALPEALRRLRRARPPVPPRPGTRPAAARRGHLVGRAGPLAPGAGGAHRRRRPRRPAAHGRGRQHGHGGRGGAGGEPPLGGHARRRAGPARRQAPAASRLGAGAEPHRGEGLGAAAGGPRPGPARPRRPAPAGPLPPPDRAAVAAATAAAW